MRRGGSPATPRRALLDWLFVICAAGILLLVVLRQPPVSTSPVPPAAAYDGTPSEEAKALIEAELKVWKSSVRIDAQGAAPRAPLIRQHTAPRPPPSPPAAFPPPPPPPKLWAPREDDSPPIVGGSVPAWASRPMSPMLQARSSPAPLPPPQSPPPPPPPPPPQPAPLPPPPPPSPLATVAAAAPAMGASLTPSAPMVAAAMMKDAPRDNVVFLKTYKTGSTTVAMFLNAIAYQRRMKMLHPLDKGWFAPGELAQRGARGERYGASFRHLSPHLEYAALDVLLPRARYATILREPVSRFVSLFNFVGHLLKQHRTAERFVTAVKQRSQAVSRDDANAFCNNMAWVLSGKPQAQTMAYAEPGEESRSMAAELAVMLEQRGVLVLMSSRMTESLLLLSKTMGWDLLGGAGTLQFKASSERVQTSKRYQCRTGPGSSCHDAILSCNGVDEALYAHYAAAFDILVASAGVDAAQVQAFDRRSKQTRAGGWARKYPVNCKKSKKDLFETLNYCG